MTVPPAASSIAPIVPALPADDPSAAPRRPGAAVAATRVVAVGCVLALVALGLAWELWLAPTGRGTLALKVVPLLLPLAGLWHMRMATYRALSLFVWLYVAEGVVRAMGDPAPGRWLALAQTLLCLLLFAACAAHVRWRLRAGRRA